jgi:hypothetical protein
MRHGIGTYFRSFPNSLKYEGEWLSNNRHGKGVLTCEREGEIWSGQWSDDIFEGIGTRTSSWTDQIGYHVSNYHGSWKNNVWHGHGKFIMKYFPHPDNPDGLENIKSSSCQKAQDTQCSPASCSPSIALCSPSIASCSPSIASCSPSIASTTASPFSASLYSPSDPSYLSSPQTPLFSSPSLNSGTNKRIPSYIEFSPNSIRDDQYILKKMYVGNWQFQGNPNSSSISYEIEDGWYCGNATDSNGQWMCIGNKSLTCKYVWDKEKIGFNKFDDYWTHGKKYGVICEIDSQGKEDRTKWMNMTVRTENSNLFDIGMQLKMRDY